MKFSMDGFRRNLSGDIQFLKSIIEDVLNDENFDKEDLVEAMNSVICNSNALNCVYVDGDQDFTNMGDLEIDILEIPSR